MKYLLLLLFPLTAFANEDNIVTWDAFSPLDQVNVQTVQIERKMEACALNAQPWVQVGEVGATAVTFTDVNLAPEPYCYRAFSWNSSVGRSLASNTAFKTVPFGIPSAPANLGVQ